jgi:hypothetical protein
MKALSSAVKVETANADQMTMSPAWRDVKRNYRESPSQQPGRSKRTQKRQPARSTMNLPMPVFLRLLRQSPPKP